MLTMWWLVVHVISKLQEIPSLGSQKGRLSPSKSHFCVFQGCLQPACNSCGGNKLKTFIPMPTIWCLVVHSNVVLVQKMPILGSQGQFIAKNNHFLDASGLFLAQSRGQSSPCGTQNWKTPITMLTIWWLVVPAIILVQKMPSFGSRGQFIAKKDHSWAFWEPFWARWPLLWGP